MPVPDFSPGEVLTAAAMDSIGLWLVKTQTVGAGVSSVVVTDAFNDNFTNYRIVYTNIIGSTNANMLLQLSGITTSVYVSGGSFTSYLSAVLSGFGPAASDSWVVGALGAGSSFGSIDVYSPKKTAQKAFTGACTSNVNQYQFSGSCTSTAQSVSFTMTSTAGVTLTGGTIRVYGYRD
jgi:hypothetical protein